VPKSNGQLRGTIPRKTLPGQGSCLSFLVGKVPYPQGRGMRLVALSFCGLAVAVRTDPRKFALSREPLASAVIARCGPYSFVRLVTTDPADSISRSFSCAACEPGSRARSYHARACGSFP